MKFYISILPIIYYIMKYRQFIYHSSDKPDTIAFRSSSLTPINGSQVTLTCTSNGMPAPAYNIESISGNNTKILQDTTSGTYSIAQINYADFIKYKVTFRCTAYNTIGNALNREVEVSIQGNVNSFMCWLHGECLTVI